MKRAALLIALLLAWPVCAGAVRVVVPSADVMSPCGPIAKNVSVEQRFTSDGTPFEAVSLLMATYARKNRSTLSFALDVDGGDRWRPVCRISIGADLLRDNEFHRWEVPAQSPQPGTRYRVRLSSPDAGTAEAVTAWVAPAAPRAVSLLVGDVERKGAIPLLLSVRPEHARRASFAATLARMRGLVPPRLWMAVVPCAVAAAVAFALIVLRLALRGARTVTGER